VCCSKHPLKSREASWPKYLYSTEDNQNTAKSKCLYKNAVDKKYSLGINSKLQIYLFFTLGNNNLKKNFRQMYISSNVKMPIQNGISVRNMLFMFFFGNINIYIEYCYAYYQM
jgi:hypothetical protein